jgi:hypothetical protein
MDLKPVHWTNLERKGVYIVDTPNGLYKGMYLTQPRYYFPYIILTFVTSNKNGKLYKFAESLFDRHDTFYEAEHYLNEINNKAKQARQQMETRALNKILKGIVNETFEWI